MQIETDNRCITCGMFLVNQYYYNRNAYCKTHYDEQGEKTKDVESYFFMQDLRAIDEFNHLEYMKGI